MIDDYYVNEIMALPTYDNSTQEEYNDALFNFGTNPSAAGYQDRGIPADVQPKRIDTDWLTQRKLAANPNAFTSSPPTTPESRREDEWNRLMAENEKRQKYTNVPSGLPANIEGGFKDVGEFQKYLQDKSFEAGEIAGETAKKEEERKRAEAAAQQAAPQAPEAIPNVKTMSDIDAYNEGLLKWKDKDGNWHFKYERPESLRPGGAEAKKYQEKADDESARIARATGIDPTKPPDLPSPHEEAMSKMRDWMRSKGDNTSDSAIYERTHLDPNAAAVWAGLQQGEKAKYQDKLAKYAMAKETFDKAMGVYTAQTKSDKPVGTLTERVDPGTGVKSYGQAAGSFGLKGGGVISTSPSGESYILPGIGSEKVNSEQVKAEHAAIVSKYQNKWGQTAARIAAMTPEAVKASNSPVVQQVYALIQQQKEAVAAGGSGADKTAAMFQNQIMNLIATPEDMAQLEKEVQAMRDRNKPDMRSPVYSVTDQGLKYTPPQGEGLPKGGRGKVQQNGTTTAPQQGKQYLNPYTGAPMPASHVKYEKGKTYFYLKNPKTGKHEWAEYK